MNWFVKIWKRWRYVEFLDCVGNRMWIRKNATIEDMVRMGFSDMRFVAKEEPLPPGWWQAGEVVEGIRPLIDADGNANLFWDDVLRGTSGFKYEGFEEGEKPGEGLLEDVGEKEEDPEGLSEGFHGVDSTMKKIIQKEKI